MMRKIKFILRILMIAFLFNILIFFSLTVNGYDIIYNAAKNLLTYKIDIYDEDFNEFDRFEKSFKKPSIYLVEEFPGMTVNHDIIINNIKYFYKTNNIKYVVTEFSYSEAQWINYYMNDENFIDLIMPILNSNEYYDLLDFIKKYNDSLNNKIQIIGINKESSIDIATDYIDHLFEQFANKRKPNEINQVFNFIAIDDMDYYQNMYNSFISNEQVYREYFVDKYFSFKLTLKNIVNMQKDDIYIDNFIDIYNENIRGQYYIQLPENMKFYELIIEKYPQFMNDIAYIKLFYDNNGFMNEDTQDIFLLNNKVFKYFENYRTFVYNLNNRHYEPYETEYGDTYFILTNPQTITPMEIIDD